jgi:ABC-type branched-subunit amino acid transport system substrate-binding protein
MPRTAVPALAVATAFAVWSPSVRAAEAPLKIALVLPTGAADAAVAAEVAAGASLAADASNDVKAAGGKRSAVEIVNFDAGDAQIASLAMDKAAKEKFAGVVAMANEAVAADLETIARRTKTALVFVGPGGPTRTIDPADPVFRADPAPEDRALQLAEWLRFRSAKSSIGLPAKTEHAWLVVEDAPWARALAASLRADDVDGVVLAGEATVKGSGANAAVSPPPGCDRVVVAGGPSAAAFVRGAAGELPMLCLDVAMNGDVAKRPHTAFLAATPSWADEKHVEDVVAKHPLKSGALTPCTVRGFVATAALIEASLNAGKKGVVAALRELHAGGGATEAPLFDPTGSVDRWRWAMWAATVESPAAPVKPAYLPDASEGLFLGGHPGARYRVTQGATCVHVGYGGGDGPPRTIEADLATIGLSGADEKANAMVRDQILARTCSKLSRVWCRHYDGSAKPAYSFRIAFVPESTPAAGASAVWEASIAGDGPDGLHGGQNFPKEHRAQALSTYLLRNASLLQKAKLTPPLAATDVQFLDNSYAWNASAEGNTRSDRIRALIDGVASTYCMKLSKEIGHLAGLDVDHSGDPRSIMVAKGGEGTSDEFGYFPPAYAKILEKTLGRVPAEGK